MLKNKLAIRSTVHPQNTTATFAHSLQQMSTIRTGKSMYYLVNNRTACSITGQSWQAINNRILRIHIHKHTNTYLILHMFKPNKYIFVVRIPTPRPAFNKSKGHIPCRHDWHRLWVEVFNSVSTADGRRELTPCLGYFVNVKDIPYQFYRRLGGPQERFGRTWGREKLSTPLGFNPRTVQHVASHYIDWETQTHPVNIE